jgi:hypothetical protein
MAKYLNFGDIEGELKDSVMSLKLMVAASNYDMFSLKYFCSSRVGMNLNLTTVLKVVDMADELGEEVMTYQCVDLIARSANKESIEGWNSYENLKILRRVINKVYDGEPGEESIPFLIPDNLQFDVSKLVTAFNDGLCADVTLVADGKEIQVNNFVLSAQSEVFRAMFEQNYSEKQTQRVNITDVDYDALHALVRFMYLPELGDEINNATAALNLMMAADKYKVLPLKELCERRVSKLLALNTILTVADVADKANASTLLANCVDFIAKNVIELTSIPDWYKFKNAKVLRLVIAAFKK